MKDIRFIATKEDCERHNWVFYKKPKYEEVRNLWNDVAINGIEKG